MSVDIFNRERRTVNFSENEAVNFEEQIMSKEKMEEHIFMPYGGC